MEIINKKAGLNFFLKERIEAGIVLSGAEAQAVRNGRIDLSNSYVKIIKGEAYLINANIPITNAINYTSTRSRKLLLHKSQIVSLHTKTTTQHLALIPTKVYNKGHLIKLQIALAKGKKKFEKKKALKLRDQNREAQEDLKIKLK
ncbi:MAG: SsrA-binding protein SmpB [Patescibacteria group bacterium]|nr:SsrA-binding protein SmpB [Patescibacteria group bacterium]